MSETTTVTENKKKIQLHALLAIEKDVNHRSLKIRREALNLFGKPTSFDEHIKTYRAFSNDDKDIPATDQKKMVTTVEEKLDYIKPFVVKELDTLCTKALSNTLAKADVVIYDSQGNITETLATGVPVSALLDMEKKFAEIRNVYAALPTTNSEMLWVKGENMEGNGCYVVADIIKSVRNRTEILYDKFDPNPDGIKPEQKKMPCKPIEKKSVTPVGEYTTVIRSGGLSPKQKSDMLERCDKVIAAIKNARSVANSSEVTELLVGNDIIKFING